MAKTSVFDSLATLDVILKPRRDGWQLFPHLPNAVYPTLKPTPSPEVGPWGDHLTTQSTGRWASELGLALVSIIAASSLINVLRVSL